VRVHWLLVEEDLVRNAVCYVLQQGFVRVELCWLPNLLAAELYPRSTAGHHRSECASPERREQEHSTARS
jgi:hypothetical protein